MNITETHLQLQEKSFKIIALADIADDADPIRMDSWDRMSCVLTHEIMNLLKNAVETVREVQIPKAKIWVEVALNFKGCLYTDICNSNLLISDDILKNLFVAYNQRNGQRYRFAAVASNNADARREYSGIYTKVPNAVLAVSGELHVLSNRFTTLP